jgi:hypothetical protein
MSNKDKFSMSEKDLERSWKEALGKKDEVFQGFDPEAGRYPVRITMAEKGESKKGRKQVVWEYVFLDGEYKGKTYRSYENLERAENLPYLMRALERLGYEAPDSTQGLVDVLKSITKTKPAIRLNITRTENKNKPGDYFTNVSIEKLLDAEEFSEQVGEEQVERTENKRSEVATKVQKETPEAEPTPSTTTTEYEAPDEIGEGDKVLCLNDDNTEAGVGIILSIEEATEEVKVNINGKKMIFGYDKLAKPPKEVVTEEPKKKTLVKRK